jgi:DNA (cytosine-5)-methyltransferase 1
MMEQQLKIGALFAGYGGLDQAVSEVTGAELAWVCEWDDAPSKILAHHYPGVPNFRDVSKVDWEAVPPVDILTGGFPCQDVSLAGSRKGLKDGTRSGLWSEFAKAIEVLKPRLVVIENVRGLLSASAGGDVESCAWCLGDDAGESHLRALGAVLGDLADLGFDARWQGVRAADAGAPHNRFRVFIVAYPSNSHGV